MIDKNLSVPRFMQLYQLLKAEIVSGKYACFEPIPSQQQLIDAHQISLITVRRALEKLSDDGYILRRQGKGCYVAPEQEWQVNRTQLLHLGMVVSSIQNSFFSEIIHGTEQFLASVNAQLTIAHSQWQPELERSQINRFVESGCQGLLVSPSQEVEAYQRLAQQGVKFVLFNHYFPGTGFPYVITDDRNGAKEAVAHLVAGGHRRIGAVIGGSGKATAADRAAGFLEGFTAAGLECRDNWISWQKNFTYDEGVAGARELLEREPALTALFCSSEVLATGAAGLLLNRGYQIPQDIAVVAFGDSDPARFFKVPLTTVAQPTARMGELAAALLVRQIRGEEIGEAQIVLPCKLVIRESSVNERLR